jgi:hypothetical protein
MNRIWLGLLAGAAGTTALNIVTYLDMVYRARPPSQTPEQSADRLASQLHVNLGDEQAAANRRSGLGPLLGYATGLATAAVYAAVARHPGRPASVGALTVLAMLASNAPMTLLKVTDPRRWSAADWAADVVPHVAYGAVTAATLRALRARA